MVQINPKQVEWLIDHQPEITHTSIKLDGKTGEYDYLFPDDIKRIVEKRYTYYLTPETYNSLPTEFKQLADATT